jgi:hypothetical protein
MVEEYSAAYLIGSLLADELLFDGRGRKWVQRKTSSTIQLIINRLFVGLRSTDLTVPLLVSNGIWQ